MIYFSTSELSGDSKTRKAQDFFYLFNDWAHFVASELKVTNPLGKKKKKERGGRECDVHEGDKLDSPKHQGLPLILKIMWHQLIKVTISS